MIRHTIVTLVLTFGFISLAQAKNACESPKDDFDNLYCLMKIYQEADSELNSYYKKLVSKLDSTGRSILKNSQLSWLEQRNDSCSRYDARGFFVNMRCATDITIERVNFLQDRLRECNSTGCQNSNLN